MDDRDTPQLGSLLNQDPARYSTPSQAAKIDPALLEIINKTDALEEKLTAAKNELKAEVADAKKDFIIFLGLFASLITYLSVEIQILKSTPSNSLLISLSLFTLAGLLLFNLTLAYIAKDKTTFKDLFNPLFIALIILTGISLYFLHNKNEDKNQPESTNNTTTQEVKQSSEASNKKQTKNPKS